MTWRVPEGVVVTRDDARTSWVLSTDLGRIVRLDEVSALIWRAADGAPDPELVVTRLAEENEWEPDAIRHHVESFIDELVACGLLEKETE